METWKSIMNYNINSFIISFAVQNKLKCIEILYDWYAVRSSIPTEMDQKVAIYE